MGHELGQFIRNSFHRWWFLFLLLLPQLLPPFSFNGYAWTEWTAVNQFVITHPIKTEVEVLFPFFKVIPLLLVTEM
jgi:hypothetical protein